MKTNNAIEGGGLRQLGYFIAGTLLGAWGGITAAIVVRVLG